MTAQGEGRWSAIASLAWRESRNTRRRLLIYMSAISMGVAALVAIDSYATNIRTSIDEQSRALLGGDVAFRSRQDFPAKLDTILDSLQRGGVDVARVTNFASMAFAPGSGLTRLVQVRAVSERYPLYGLVVTNPAAAWSEFRSGAQAIVDPSILTTLKLSIGDSLRIGMRAFEVSGVLVKVPGDAGVIAAVGPRVFIPTTFLDETQLLAFGSVAQREALLRLGARESPENMIRDVRRQLDSNAVRGRTAAQSEERLAEDIEELMDFLGLVGIVALLLGGVGVASGVHAHIARKVDTVAVLRSIGATSGQVLALYVSQAAAMGIVGAMLGAALGVAVQFVLPLAASDFLPVDVTVTVVWSAVIAGILAGGWIALSFALLPLLGIRKISPLQALRRNVQVGEGKRAWLDPLRIGVVVAMAASLTAVAADRTGTFMAGLGVTLGVVAVIALLTLVASGLAGGARRLLRTGWPFVVRQGVANLYRPGNQTRSVMLALGFGSFLIAALYLVQANLLRQFEGLAAESRGNLLLFDIMEDQAASVDSILASGGAQRLELTPIVTMRIAGINSRVVRDNRGGGSGRGDEGGPGGGAGAGPGAGTDSGRGGGRGGGGGGGGWSLRREYRSTYTDMLDSSEVIIAGTQFGVTQIPAGYAEVSFESMVAEELRVSLGDTVVWDVQGVKVGTIVTSLREVDWGKLETNFFAVFGPSSIQAAPKQFALLARVPEGQLGLLQGRVVDSHANVSAIDLTLVAQTIASIQEKASMAIRFTTLFSLLMGIPVLMSAISATRRERVREGVLLRTLGASRRQIQRIMLSEYAILGLLGTLTGALLGIVGAAVITVYFFERPFVAISGEMAIVSGLMICVTVIIGYLSGRDVYRATPAEALRE